MLKINVRPLVVVLVTITWRSD